MYMLKTCIKALGLAALDRQILSLYNGLKPTEQGHIRILPAKFGQNPTISVGDVL